MLQDRKKKQVDHENRLWRIALEISFLENGISHFITCIKHFSLIKKKNFYICYYIYIVIYIIFINNLKNICNKYNINEMKQILFALILIVFPFHWWD